MSKLYDFGLVGLGVMGRNFILNVADNDFSACGLDLDPEKVSALEQEGDPEKVKATTSGEEFVNSLATPRKIMLLVPAGAAVDSVIESLLPFIEKGDVIIDGGNSFFTDTDRREKYLSEKGISYFGSGVSGGAKGARFGPSIMPGGSEDAYQHIKPIFEAVSAKVNGEPCVTYLGPKSAGNYVKMVHNGIEYGMMQLISEVYDLLKKVGGLSNEELHQVFDSWNKGRLQSFLVEITAEIFLKKAEDADTHLVDLILDKAKQKGTGKWTSQNAMDLGIAVPTIDAAVSLRELSAKKEERVAAEAIYGKSDVNTVSDKDAFIRQVEQALYFSFILSYAQGFSQLSAASEEYGYNLDMEAIARIWRGGCIIRAGLLEDIRSAFKSDTSLSHLLLDEGIAKQVKETAAATREILAFALQNGVPATSMAASLSYFDVFTSGKLPLNLVQAQRDHFGAHTYERIDKEGIFHTEW